MSLRKTINIPTAYEKAVVFNGSTQYAYSSNAAFNFNTAVTMGVFIKMGATAQVLRALMGNDSWRLETSSSGDPVFSDAGQFAMIAKSRTLLDQKWHLAVVTYNKVTSVAYRDDRLVGSEAHTNAMATPSQPFTIGAKYDASAKANCQMKHAFVFNTAITDAQIQTINALGPTSDLVTYLKSIGALAIYPFNNSLSDVSGNGYDLTGAGTPTFADVNGSDLGRGIRTSI